MTATHAQRPLAGPLRARINRLAHSQALQHEICLKAGLIEQLTSARNAGASFADLSALVAKLEAAPPGGRQESTEALALTPISSSRTE